MLLGISAILQILKAVPSFRVGVHLKSYDACLHGRCIYMTHYCYTKYYYALYKMSSFITVREEMAKDALEKRHTFPQLLKKDVL